MKDSLQRSDDFDNHDFDDTSEDFDDVFEDPGDINDQYEPL